MSLLRWIKSRILAPRKRTVTTRYVITYEVGGCPIKYFTWDYYEVWRWTKTPSKAVRFHSPEQARLEADSTSMGQRTNYTVRPINT